MLRAQRGRLRQQLCSVRKPADGPPACDLASDTLGWRNGARVARINQLQVDAGLIGVSEILSVRRDVSVGRRIAGRIGSEPTGLRFRKEQWSMMYRKPHQAEGRDQREQSRQHQRPAL